MICTSSSSSSNNNSSSSSSNNSSSISSTSSNKCFYKSVGGDACIYTKDKGSNALNTLITNALNKYLA
ncbi:hypothetical protein P8C59_003890 [Phyllachora maydis]|uniref:Uncharacterized protein n=1 Tax=Phyllachora maydis TaxID=1825666 RepID=A0AAD9I1M0_9PEZI|nr:hypothetical protein P8C59_003890 [Phyllachora maydis]